MCGNGGSRFGSRTRRGLVMYSPPDDRYGNACHRVSCERH